MPETTIESWVCHLPGKEFPSITIETYDNGVVGLHLRTRNGRGGFGMPLSDDDKRALRAVLDASAGVREGAVK